MDEVDFIDDAYILEVSSPGLGRTLKKDKHLEKAWVKKWNCGFISPGISRRNLRVS